MKPLKTGVAYHGNRMPSHAREDLKEIVDADMDIVVHMLSHMDWDRHISAMKDIVSMSEDMGLEVWIDNWGIGGRPGDYSRYLACYPDDHMIFGNGKRDNYQACLNSPDYRAFVKKWIDAVATIGGKTIFWDEPQILGAPIGENKQWEYCCHCPRCKKLFEERYNKPMPRELTPEFSEFRVNTIIDFFREVTDYANACGMKNTACIMPGENAEKMFGITMQGSHDLIALPAIDSIGYDPYWFGNGVDPYEFVYNETKSAISMSDAHGKGHNIWIQGYNAPRGKEEEIILATEAAYDAGAKTILSWSFHAGESNNYASENAQKSWNMTVEGLKRVKARDRDRMWEEARKKYMK